ncbi:MAG: M42 family metallopeptidase, partial [Clostridiales bacterium]|nr:M42 family metallopeptidase [Clostridiales bacterium]
MDKQRALDLIGALSDANGAPGFEDEVVEVVRGYAGDLGLVGEDNVRNCYIRRHENTGDRPVVQLDAHTDEVAFMVQSICADGTLKFVTMGGWVPACVPAHLVRVRTASGAYVPGVIASKPPHYLTEAERNAPPKIADMVIDIGATSREDAVNNFGARIAEPVVPEAAFAYDEAHDLLLGKAFDCRLGCAALLTTLRAIAGQRLSVDVVGALATQEEMGLRGARVTANAVKPDLAIVFEGCPADDTFGDASMAQTAIKKGPMLRHIDAGMITHPRFQRFALDLGERLGLPVQQAVRSGGSTNGGAIHLSGLGVPCIVIGLPVRYIHTHHGIASFADFGNAVKLATALLEGL